MVTFSSYSLVLGKTSPLKLVSAFGRETIDDKSAAAKNHQPFLRECCMSLFFFFPKTCALNTMAHITPCLVWSWGHQTTQQPPIMTLATKFTRSCYYHATIFQFESWVHVPCSSFISFQGLNILWKGCMWRSNCSVLFSSLEWTLVEPGEHWRGLGLWAIYGRSLLGGRY